MSTPFVLQLGLLLLAAASAAGTSAVDAYCQLINSRIPSRISYPESPAYNDSISTYYSGQERDLRPGCIFSPQDAHEVSQFVKLVSSPHGDCTEPPQFAVRSGGHMIWRGAANVEAGITVDMRAMNSVELSEDKTVASLGAGGVWSDIYPQLVPLNLTIMGGRVVGIGIGGLATGGGIHYLSRRNGWVCDNIYRYEVVLASGEIVEATASSHADLWRALKGGSNNFGIVTRIDVPTFAQGLMWGGNMAFNYTPEVLDAHARAFSDFMSKERFDDAADMGMALLFAGGAYSFGDSLFYVEPVENPPTYQPFTSIPSRTGGNLGLKDAGNLTNASPGSLSPDATRAIDIVYSFKNGDADLYSRLFSLWEDGSKNLAAIEGLQLTLLIQPQPVTNGTNSLGLTPGEKDVVMNVLTAAYTNREDDDAVQAGMQAIVDAHKEFLEEQGLLVPYQYLNYADKSQDPIASYGDKNKATLQAVSKKYDPEGLFQKGVPGGFKLFP